MSGTETVSAFAYVFLTATFARLNSEEGVVGVERRNYHDRANTLRRVLLWMQSERAPVAAVPDNLTTAEVGIRILKQLALRGLVRITDQGWMPQPLLLNPALLVEVA